VERGAYEKLLVGVEKDFSISKCTRLAFSKQDGNLPYLVSSPLQWDAYIRIIT
jgi:hypothetical protein